MTTEEKPTEQRGMTMKTKVKIALSVIIGIIVLVLIFQNIGAVPTQVLWYEFNIPHALMLLIMLAIGFGAGVLATGAAYRKRAKR